MYIPFEQLPYNARIWIYQADRMISGNEQNDINNQLIHFIEDWTSHSTQLRASFLLKHNYFIIIGVDKDFSFASGCSIDQLLHFIKHLGIKFNIDFLNRLNILTQSEGKLMMFDFHQLKEKLHDLLGHSEVKIFNNLIQTKSELEKNWLINIEDSWLKS